MKALVLALLLLPLPLAADIGSYPAPGVRQHHDRMPTTLKQDNECNENHNLKPDGDSDCDDPSGAPGVPEPPAWALMLAAFGIGYGSLALADRRRKRK